MKLEGRLLWVERGGSAEKQVCGDVNVQINWSAEKM